MSIDPLAFAPESGHVTPLPGRGRFTADTLPYPLTTLVGREREIAIIVGLLSDPAIRLVTLTGPGGVGKTRLALHVATAVSPHFADGIALVPLAPVRDPDLVPAAIAQVLGVREARDVTLLSRLKAFLHDKHFLLVVDNAEHLLDAAPLLTELLTTCPRLHVLVTSRAVLRLSGERDVLVPPLALPDPHRPLTASALAACDAIQLFAERARAGSDTFQLTPDNAPTIAAICRRLDGLPLAIELAASRINHLPPHALLNRLEHRLPLLTGGPRDLPDRLRTMRDAIAWSYDLLDPIEQALFRHVAVFAEGWTLLAAAGVTRWEDDPPRGALLDRVASLVDRSLVRVLDGAPSADDDGPSYGMLETIREFGTDLLVAHGEIDTLRDQHTTHYLAFAESGAAALRGQHLPRWLDRFEAAHDNLRAALGWYADRRRSGPGLRLAGALHWFWFLHSHYTEGRRWLDSMLSLPDDTPPDEARARALIGAGILAYAQADYPVAEPRLAAGIDLARRLGARALAAHGLDFVGLMAYRRGLYDQMERALTEAVALAREAGDQWVLASALCSLGFETPGTDLAAGRAHTEESVAIFRALGDVWGLARSLNSLGETARSLGAFAQAETHYQESLELYRVLGDTNATALVSHNLGYVAQARGHTLRGAHAFAEGLRIHAGLGDQRGVAHCLAGLAAMIGLLGHPAESARLLAAADALFDTTGSAMDPVDRAAHDRNVAEIRRRLGEPAYAAQHDTGRTLRPERAVADALALLDEIDAGAARTQPVAARTATDGTDFGLSPREVEVLRLLVEGNSDAEIADRLFITRRTASNHVASILIKLGVSNRTAAVAIAIRRQLV